MALTRREPRQKSLKSFAIIEQICFMRGWYAGIEGTRWRTLDDFLADADAVRDELLTDPTIRKVYGDLEPFADRLRRDMEAMPGAVYEQHGHPHPYPWPALRHAHVHHLDDGHTHDDDGIGDGSGDVPPTGRRRVLVPA
jgi:hypothetical protein